jgi:hypothetical protein
MASGIKQRKMNSKTTKNELVEGSFIAFPPRQNIPTACNIGNGHRILQMLKFVHRQV